MNERLYDPDEVKKKDISPARGTHSERRWGSVQVFVTSRTEIPPPIPHNFKSNPSVPRIRLVKTEAILRMEMWRKLMSLISQARPPRAGLSRS